MNKIIGKIISCFICSLSSVLLVSGQTTFTLPQEVTLKTAEDYARYERTVVDATKWLEETDLDKEVIKRQNVILFIIEWVSGSPTVSVEITDNLGKIYGKNNDLLAIYIARAASNQIESKDTTAKLPTVKAGLISMMQLYKKGIGIRKSKEMEKLIKLTEEGKLDSYISENFK